MIRIFQSLQKLGRCIFRGAPPPTRTQPGTWYPMSPARTCLMRTQSLIFSLFFLFLLFFVIIFIMAVCNFLGCQWEEVGGFNLTNRPRQLVPLVVRVLEIHRSAVSCGKGGLHLTDVHVCVFHCGFMRHLEQSQVQKQVEQNSCLPNPNPSPSLGSHTEGCLPCTRGRANLDIQVSSWNYLTLPVLFSLLNPQNCDQIVYCSLKLGKTGKKRSLFTSQQRSPETYQCQNIGISKPHFSHLVPTKEERLHHSNTFEQSRFPSKAIPVTVDLDHTFSKIPFCAACPWALAH